MRKDTGRTRARQKLFRLCNGSNACSIFETRARDVHSTECTELEAASEPRTWHEQVSAPSTSINCMRFRMQPVPDPRCLCFQRRARNATGESRVRKDHFGDKTQEFQGDFSWKLNDKLIRVIFLYGAKKEIVSNKWNGTPLKNIRNVVTFEFLEQSLKKRKFRFESRVVCRRFVRRIDTLLDFRIYRWIIRRSTSWYSGSTLVLHGELFNGTSVICSVKWDTRNWSRCMRQKGIETARYVVHRGGWI